MANPIRTTSTMEDHRSLPVAAAIEPAPRDARLRSRSATSRTAMEGSAPLPARVNPRIAALTGRDKKFWRTLGGRARGPVWCRYTPLRRPMRSGASAVPLRSSSSMQNLVAPNPNKSVAHPPVRGIERGHYLIVAAPVLNVLADLEAKLADALVEDPQAGRTHTLQRVVLQLRGALTRAEEIEVWGSLQDVHELTGRAKSTLTEWAGKHGNGVWCWKKSGVWGVDIEKFDAWYRTRLPDLEKRRRAAKRASADGRRIAASARGVTQ